jgi:aminodeoxyfutalosine synthase
VATLADLESRAAAGESFDRAAAERVLAHPDLIAVGALGEGARRFRHGNRVTYGRVAFVSADGPSEPGEAGECRLVGVPGSVDEARARVRAAAASIGEAVLTGFSLADLVDLVGGDHLALAELAAALRADGLEAVAEVPLDRLGDVEHVVEVVTAVAHGGLGAWRATVERAGAADRLEVIERAVALQRETGALRAFAPLPRADRTDAPSTGYDDVRTVAVAQLMVASVPAIQVDWVLHGPKLAQVALAYGASDIDGVAAVDLADLGRRRSARADIERQVRSAFADPVERNGRYETRA